jgi:hypothetical protein
VLERAIDDGGVNAAVAVFEGGRIAWSATARRTDNSGGRGKRYKRARNSQTRSVPFCFAAQHPVRSFWVTPADNLQKGYLPIYTGH